MRGWTWQVVERVLKDEASAKLVADLILTPTVLAGGTRSLATHRAACDMRRATATM